MIKHLLYEGCYMCHFTQKQDIIPS